MAAPYPNQQSARESQVFPDTAAQDNNTVNATLHHVNPENRNPLYMAQYKHDDHAAGVPAPRGASHETRILTVPMRIFTVPMHVPGHLEPQLLQYAVIPTDQLGQHQAMQSDPFTTNDGSFGSLHYPTSESAAPFLPAHGSDVLTSHGHVAFGYQTPDSASIKQGETSIAAAQPRPTTFAEFVQRRVRPPVQFGQLNASSVFSRSMPKTNRGPPEEISEEDENPESGFAINSDWEVETPTRKIDTTRRFDALTLPGNKDAAALGTASHSPPPSLEKLYFLSMAEAETAAEVESSAWKRVALQVKEDDWREVEANPQFWVYWLIQAFHQPYHRHPVDGTTVLTGACLAEWLHFQEEHKIKAEKAIKDARQLEISAWMVLRTVLETHQVGARVLKKFSVDVDTRCSDRVRAVCRTLADYPIVRFDVLRGQRVNNLAANPALVGARKIVNFRGNYGKAVTSRSGGGPSGGRGARDRRQSPSLGQEEEDVVAAATPSRSSKKRKAVAGSGSGSE